MPTEISQQQYLQLLGLKTLAEQHDRILHVINNAVIELLSGKGNDHVEGHVSDFVFGDRSLDDLLKILNIAVA